VIVLLNGAFGVGKTAVARALRARMPRSVLYDPELVGIALQRLRRWSGRPIDDFQDLPLWRRLTIGGIHAAGTVSPTVVVPMAISNPAYLAELRAGVRRFEPRLRHYCLVAPPEVVHRRLTNRGADPLRHEWQFRRASACCEAHRSDDFAKRIDATNHRPDELAAILEALLEQET
jgi:hypothetical protein